MKGFFLLISITLLSSRVFCQEQLVTFTIDLKKKAQTIENIGASGAWYTEAVGRYWPAEKKEAMARLLFSKAFDKSGNPLGIGLSAWRFNIGGGTAEQGDSSGISNPQKRVECFLSPTGAYNWNKQQGYLWFVKQAAAYGVKDLIAFSNTAPVQFTKNGLGFKNEKDFKSNLKEENYHDYADFLATVIRHFDNEGLHFNYISPVNEPQWDWSGKFGQMSQEGSPWSNRDIHKIALHLDSSLRAKKLSTKMLFSEAGDLRALYEGDGHAGRQVQHFYDPASPFYLGKLKTLHPIIAGHSYFTDIGDTTIFSVRKKLNDTLATYNGTFWQSEYSMLGNGFKEGKRGRTGAIDCALFLGKIIHHDFVVANAAAWHFWNAWEPGRADVDTRYYLLALKQNAENTGGGFTVTKNLWALGHYSRFVRPGMQRIIVTERSDGLNLLQAADDIMLSAFSDGKKVIIVAINYTNIRKEIHLDLQGIKNIKSFSQFVTNADSENNMTRIVPQNRKRLILLPRSINTMVIDVNLKR
jgi:O-glycosyl hydrolase